MASRPPEPQCVLITGASGAIGQALALQYAAAGVLLILQGRRVEMLESLARQCQLRGAQTQVQSVDVCDSAALQSWLAGVLEQNIPDLVIINAGQNTHGRNGNVLEPLEAARSVLDVNLKSVVTMVHAVVPAMQARGSGQIALVSSLAGYFGLPPTPTYCASKAGLKAYGEALRGALASKGIKVSVIMPGYVQSPMCEAMPGPKPFVCTPEKAAARIQRGLLRNRARISFPFPLNLGSWFLAVLPASWSGRIVSWLGYRV